MPWLAGNNRHKLQLRSRKQIRLLLNQPRSPPNLTIHNPPLRRRIRRPRGRTNPNPRPTHLHRASLELWEKASFLSICCSCPSLWMRHNSKAPYQLRRQVKTKLFLNFSLKSFAANKLHVYDPTSRSKQNWQYEFVYNIHKCFNLLHKYKP